MNPHTENRMHGLRAWWNSDLLVLVKRLLVVYAALFVCRVVFYLYNAPALGPIGEGQFWTLLKGSILFDTASIGYINALFVILSLLPLRVREKPWYQRTLFGYWIAVNGLAVVVNLADAVYFRGAGSRFTADEFMFAQNDNTLRIILRAAADNWYMLLIAAALIAAMCWAYRRCGQPRTPIRGRFAYFFAGLLMLAGASVLVLGGIRGGFGRSVRPITLSNATLYAPSPAKANLILSNPFAIIRTAGKGRIHYTRYFADAELDAIFTPYHYPTDDYPRPTLEGYNIVVFVLESFSAEHSAFLNPGLYPDGRGYTPFLDSLMRGGYALTSAFSNGHKSIEALPSVFTSIPSFKTPFVLTPQSLGEMRGLPALLAEEGYETSFFCGSPRGSMGFGAYATAAGIRELFCQEDYEARHGRNDRDGYWGIWDEPFLAYMVEELDAKREPFFSSVFTLSSHHPFVVPDQYKDTFREGRTRIHKGVQYTDHAIRGFFEKAAGSAWFDRTIFVFVADHVSSEIYAPETFTPTGRSHILMFFYTPGGLLRGVDDTPAQQTDIMPTLLGLTGYEKPYFAFGRDLLGDPDRIPMAANYTNQFFQGITDSVVIFFDEERVRSAYARSDTLQRHDLSGMPNDAVDRAERQLKAIIQQYYQHLEQKRYVVPVSATVTP